MVMGAWWWPQQRDRDLLVIGPCMANKARIPFPPRSSPLERERQTGHRCWTAQSSGHRSRKVSRHKATSWRGVTLWEWITLCRNLVVTVFLPLYLPAFSKGLNVPAGSQLCTSGVLSEDSPLRQKIKEKQHFPEVSKRIPRSKQITGNERFVRSS